MLAPNLFMDDIDVSPESLNKMLEHGDYLRQQGYRGRFAPTPSGDLHLGNLRTALIAWLRARLFSGKFLLRIDDLDKPRNRLGSSEKIKDDLSWLGITWDKPTIFQSERINIYSSVLSILRSEEKLFPCTCSRRMLSKANDLQNGPFLYSGKCREKKKFTEYRNNRKPSWRLKVAKEFSFLCGDIIVRRADGLIAYHLATVVDELTLGINEVVRGQDLAEQVFAQLAIIKALRQGPISYKHAPLLLDFEGRKLSKTNKDHSLVFYRDKGFSASKIIGLLASSLNLVPKGSDLSALELLSELKNDNNNLKSIFNRKVQDKLTLLF
nr:tRNA glutamyl-Q(34) synthetase GluQRS [Prochlorococcus marinus]